MVGVVIRSVERYDLVKIKLRESERQKSLRQNTDSAYDSVAYLKTILSESQAEAEE